MIKASGLILGKFMPPHNGHEYLIRFGENYLKQLGGGKLYVVVDRLENEPIKQSLRVRWLQEKFPNVSIIPLGDFNPQQPSDSPTEKEFWDTWEKSLKNALPEKVDYIFGSEDYCWTLADRLGATCVPVDNFRNNYSISATEIRNDPFAHWEQIPENVRPHFVKKVCVIGPESTGKSTLVKKLAEHFNTVSVPEYAAVYLNAMKSANPNRHTQYEDIAIFANGQIASEDSLTKDATRVLICDTDVLTTKLWSQRLYPKHKPQYPKWFDDVIADRTYDLYIIANPDTPWVPDVHRQWSSESSDNRRQGFYHKIAGELSDLGKNFVVVSGTDFDDRIEQAKAAVTQHIFKGKDYGFGKKP